MKVRFQVSTKKVRVKIAFVSTSDIIVVVLGDGLF